MSAASSTSVSTSTAARAVGVQVSGPLDGTHELGCATDPLIDVEVQTDEGDRGLPTAEALCFQRWEAPPEITAFLRRTAPAMEAQLAKNARSRAFKGYDALFADADADDELGLLNAFRIAFVQPDEVDRLREEARLRADPKRGSAVDSGGSMLGPASQPQGVHLPCTGVAWNCTGTLLAACFGHFEHGGWCSHKAGAAVWSVNRTSRRAAGAGGDGSGDDGEVAAAAAAETTRVLSQGGGSNPALAAASVVYNESLSDAPPETVLDTPGCLTAVAFHPTHPTLLAAGTFSGEIIVWDVAPRAGDRGDAVAASASASATGGAASAAASGKSSTGTSTTAMAATAAASSSGDGALVVARTRADDYLHRDSINALTWVQEPVSRSILLASVSGDGKALLWTLANGLALPVQGFSLTARVASQGGRAGLDSDDDDDGDDSADARARRRRRAAASTTGASSAGVPLSATCCSFLQDGASSAQFFAGTLAGGVYKGMSTLHPTATTMLSSAALSSTSSSAGGRVTYSSNGVVVRSAAAGSASTAGLEALFPREAMRTFLRPGAVIGAETTLPWEAQAAAAISRVPAGDRPAAARSVEKYAREAGAGAVNLAVMYASRPADTRSLLPNAVTFTYAAHASGAVLGIAASPFVRNALLTAGADGEVRLYSSLAQHPLLRLRASAAAAAAAGGGSGAASGGRAVGAATGSTTASSSSSGGSASGALFAGAWSKARPCVFGVASADGSVYVFDLYQSTAGPVAALASNGAYSIGGVPVAGAIKPPSMLPRGLLPPPSFGGGSAAASAVASGASSVARPASAVGGGGGSAAVASSPLAVSASFGMSAVERPVVSREASKATLCLAFNPKHRRLLACGHASGAVHVWKLGWRLGAVQREEGVLLRDFVAAAAVSEVDVETGAAAAAPGGKRDAAAGGGDAPTAVNSIESFLQDVDRRLDEARDLL